MARYNAFRSALALLLIAGVTIGAPAPAHAGLKTLSRPAPVHAGSKTLSKQGVMQVQVQEARSLKKLDKNYAKQANAQAQYYSKLAQQVAKAGGNAQPLLDAAAYFGSEGKK